MSSRPKEVMWEAPSHTIAKIKMLQTYLTVYLLILARKLPGKPILFIDGFAGPDEYKNHPSGSPSAMLAAARDASRQLGVNWTAGYLYCAFVEEKKERYEHLVARVSEQDVPRTEIRTYHGRFDLSFEAIKRDIPEPFRSASPLFAFIDPFGAKGAPFTIIKEILSSDSSEILLNFDSDGIARIKQYPDELDAIFGNNEWREIYATELRGQRLWSSLVELYKQRLQSIPNVKYVFATEMRGRGDKHSYYLVFASKHKKGLEKMKEAMCTIVKDSSYVFSESKLNQPSIPMLFDDSMEYANRMFENFQGTTVPYDKIHDWALLESPFFNAIQMLRGLAERGKIKANRKNVTGRSTGWSDKHILSVEFLQGGPISGSLFDN